MFPEFAGVGSSATAVPRSSRDRLRPLLVVIVVASINAAAWAQSTALDPHARFTINHTAQPQTPPRTDRTAPPPTPAGDSPSSFVNWESPHVHPLDITPDRRRLLAVNTADNRLEVFDITTGTAIPIGSIPVGLDPVSVRARTDDEAWVVNHISDTVSIVRLSAMNVVETVPTLDEPADVVFAGHPQRAFIACSQANTILAVNPNDPSAQAITIPIDAEKPRAMTVSADGNEIYVAIFESGNATTILPGGDFETLPVNLADGPYGGQNPPPNVGSEFSPPQNPLNPPPPKSSLIVKRRFDGRWTDDNAGDWSTFIDGALAHLSLRQPGWQLLDHDVAVINTATLDVDYIDGLMNICMAVAIRPVAGLVTVIGTDATNHVRFEPVLRGRFLRVNLAIADPTGKDAPAILDLNQHLTYSNDIPFVPIPQPDRDRSIGDPRAIVWAPTGLRAYIAGMGSNNVAIINASGVRQSPIGDPSAAAIEVGAGPTGLALDSDRGRLYVLNRFSAAVTVIATSTEVVLETVPFFDPTPPAVKTGRKHLYDTHKNSGLGHIACASCHVDARTDRLAWDLGNPAGEMRTFDQNCAMGLMDNCVDWHPMKGPLLTQTLQDIIGKEPFHWRGDRNGIEEFNGAFVSLQGDDAMLTPQEMQKLEDFLATVAFPPNPFRAFDNSLRANLPLPGHYETGMFGNAGDPLPNGNAQSGLDTFMHGGFQCTFCHTLPTGTSSDLFFDGTTVQQFATGPNGERHNALIVDDGSETVMLKPPQLRNLYERVGFDYTQLRSRTGFGFLHNGVGGSLARLVSSPVFEVHSTQDVADLVAFLLSFSGSDLPVGSSDDLTQPLGPTSRDTHAAVGRQLTFAGGAASAAGFGGLPEMFNLADTGRVGLAARGVVAGLSRGYVYRPGGSLQSDRAAESASVNDFVGSLTAEDRLTFTIVPTGSQDRIGIDRDDDGFFDTDELEQCGDPADADVIPDPPLLKGDANRDGIVDIRDFEPFHRCAHGGALSGGLTCRCTFDFNRDGRVDLPDFAVYQTIID
ncbi:MAG: hypothetical protein HOP29_05540 [Phycisphaerales bacterium]|nr:hypothetical protein [Phycisphaerales bacterium]